MKNKNQKRISALMVAFLLFTGFRVFNKYNTKENIKPSDESSITVNKTESNLKIKYLKTGTDDKGKEYVSFNYEVLPAEANDKTVSLNMAWSENGVSEDVNSHLTYEHKQDEYFVKVTMLAKANHQATLTLTSNANKNAKASITIDFEQEFLGFSQNSRTIAKDLKLTDGETLTSEDEIKNTIMSFSKGFLGTISVNEKEISNYTSTLREASLVINWPFKLLINGDQNYSNAYNEALLSTNSSTTLISKVSQYIKDNLTDAQKELIRNGDKLQLVSIHDITFTYYGQEYTFTLTSQYNVATSHFADSTYVDVSSITTEGNIIFK